MEYKVYLKKMKRFQSSKDKAASVIMFTVDRRHDFEYIHIFMHMFCRSGEWGDHLTLQAAADRVKLALLISRWLDSFCTTSA
jgi:hypothetical protein